MLDVGWTELLLIGVVALIVIGPKDLPMMFHTLGRIMARARGMAREFSSAMEDAAKASGLDETRKELRAAKARAEADRIQAEAEAARVRRAEALRDVTPRDADRL